MELRRNIEIGEDRKAQIKSKKYSLKTNRKENLNEM